jgi:thioesterase domain-containing protein/acyl carrier protein
VTLDVVRAHIAAILGYSDPAAVDPDLTFVELGVDSLGVMELRDQLGSAFGREIPASILAEQPTVLEIAREVTRLLDPTTPNPVEEEQSAETFVPLLGPALDEGRASEFVGLLERAAGFRPSFDAAPEADEPPKLLRLADGPEQPSLVLVPSLIAVSNPQEYVRFAKPFRGDRRVLAAPLSGFLEGEHLPADLDAVAQLTAAAIRKAECGPGVVLVGYSSGGWAAHLAAVELERQGVAPGGVIFLDTPSTSLDTSELLHFIHLFNQNADEHSSIELDDTRLTAMARYFQLFSEWTPAELKAPVLMVRASESFGGSNDQVSHLEEELTLSKSVEVPGNHLTMMWDHAETTAQVVREMIERLPNNSKGS